MLDVRILSEKRKQKMLLIYGLMPIIKRHSNLKKRVERKKLLSEKEQRGREKIYNLCIYK